MNGKDEDIEGQDEDIEGQDEDIESQDGDEEHSTDGEEESPAGDDDSGDDAGDLVVSIGEEEPSREDYSKAPAWVRDLRKASRDKDRRIRELEAAIGKQPDGGGYGDPGARPELEDSNYDVEKYESALAEWLERKRRVADARAAQDAEERNQQREWNGKLEAYSVARDRLNVRDFEDTEAIVQDAFTVTQQGILLQGAENPALLVYALGKNPKKAQALAQIKDPVKFAFAVARLETEVKISKRGAPPPEKQITGTGRMSGAVDSTLERLRAAAEKTGDMSKVMEYKRQQKRKNA